MNSSTQFLVDRILHQASRQSILLTPVEIGMLGFCEPTATPEDKETSAIFERDYNSEEYEAKITHLVHDAYEHDIASGMKPQWDQALDDLADDDIYLFVMLENAGIVKTTTRFVLPDWRMLVGVIPVLLCLGLAILVVTPIAARVMPNTYLRIAICILLLLAPFLLGRRGSRAG